LRGAKIAGGSRLLGRRGVIEFPRGIFSQETMMKLGNITNNANWASVFGVAEISIHRFSAVGIMV
jgi:hypothetical protein